MSAFNLHATTVVGIIHNGKAAIGSDGQATLDKTVMKSTVKKVRKLYDGKVLAALQAQRQMLFLCLSVMKKN